MYLIEHRLGESGTETFPVIIDLAPIDNLRLHEETIDSAVDKLVGDLTASAVLDNPVVIERDTGVVLDGMHRTLALKAMGFGLIPVQSVDVARAEELHRRSLIDEPILQNWYWGIRACARSISADNLAQAGLIVADRIALNKVLKPGDDHRSDMDNLSGILARYEAAVGFVAGDLKELTVLNNSRGPCTLGDQLRRLSGWLEDQGFPIDYRTRQVALRSMPDEALQALLIPPQVTMDEVRKAADGPPLPPKSTCFVLPARALQICLPLDILREGTRTGLDSFLAEKPLYRIKGPAVVGRHYCEPGLYLFERPETLSPDTLMESCPPGNIA